ncbi:ribonuclease Y [Tuwongella immobilis]|uniref:Ribonuclease Y n=1 Tax=Tuwongella immobilis TaxID=692036 RepID=A0A6C2YRA7_9BACT|nr:ribonuclease Y [Tuwongella immobilis]VIP04190.1 rna binding metal dependent phosphohydrolase : Ribonuclease Y OS=Planctomyces limnophilus (strain ATCC 43296 / DSM 3776 / IFAM 1008 / 290) GN=rny PE=3 SV=1: DUF3552: KH_1: HD [Tuwongella immobilis]VTS05744.1 rna binding metal dependent phosphohydrolase : Ribonuclease Y OS=Planctomyces limnophilus (strain ATCC 43296 / DSM 3776 / IFAM 1008 / 290) GN=rny PE=3 SV=1: DUF3552: KH_1: HD [Tuwongella immobilis]
MGLFETIALTVGAAVIAATLGFALAKRLERQRQQQHVSDAQQAVIQAQAQAQQILADAARDAERLFKEADLRAKDEQIRRREELNREAELARNEVREQERRLEKREDLVEQKHQLLLKKERSLEHTQKKLADRREVLERKTREVDELCQQQIAKLQEISGMNREQVERLLFERVERELNDRLAQRITRFEERFRQETDQRARSLLAMAIHRYAAQHTTDTTVSTVDIPSDDMKGRIIGREGRNIRTFEKCTGVDVIVDDTPGVVIVSAFDNVRRETARLALTKLIQDGRIHPTRIEEVVAETQKEMDRTILEVGRDAVQQADIGMVHEKIQQLLGRLKFRTSYSQNVLQHSLEVCFLAGMIADELGLNGQLARRCALLHDIGKAADHEMEGGHPKIGAELARRYGETSPEVLHAIAGHHDDIQIDNVYTVLVATADAISASRPGARRETLEKYVKRLEELEAVACGFPGVEQAFAIQAGRELRVIADAVRTTDAEAQKICYDIARSIEKQLDYPGEIKVTVVRELRAVEVAK